MITMTADQQAELAKRTSRVELIGTWTYDASAGSSKNIGVTGFDATGIFRHDILRFKDANYTQRIPYLGDGLEFPNLNIICDAGAGSVDWYDFTQGAPLVPLARSPLVGGALKLYAGIWLSDTCMTSVQIAQGTVKELRKYGSPPMMEMVATSQHELLSDMTWEGDIQREPAGAADFHDTPPYICGLGFQTIDYTSPAHYDGTSFSTAETALDASGVHLRLHLLQDDHRNCADDLVRFAWHGYGSLYINSSDQLSWYSWATSARTPDATWTTSEIVSQSGSLVPRLDRGLVNMRIRGTNPWASAYEIAILSSTGSGWYGSPRRRTFQLDWYAQGSDICQTSVVAGWSNPYRLFDGTYPSVPHQFRCSVPFGVGLKHQLGDKIAIKYEPAGLYSYTVWRIEEISFRLSTMQFDMILHDRF